MVKPKTTVQLTSGSFYYLDRVNPKRQIQRPQKPRKIKRILSSRKLKPGEDVVYIEARANFELGQTQFLLQKTKKSKRYISDIHKATVFKQLPKTTVPLAETLPRTRCFIVIFPKKLWKNKTKRIELLEEYYPKKYYPDLYLTPERQSISRNLLSDFNHKSI